MRRTLQRCASSPAPTILSLGNARTPFSLLQRRLAISNHCRTKAVTLAVRDFHRTCIRREETVVKAGDGEIDQGETVKSSAPITRFEELESREILHKNIVENLKSMGVETMTEVQSATINEALKGNDIIAQAKTGTGKTLAFLIPILQNIINADPGLAQRVHSRRGPRSTADDIRAIIISPTRELAEQIAAEAKKVVHRTGIIVQTAVGGTQKAAGLRAIQREGCHILVGTPGRLLDLLSSEYSRVEAPDLKALVLDEADRLLDDGFWANIQEIMTHLPDRNVKDRQTLMFSATVPREIVRIVRSTLKPGFQFVKCVRDDEAPTHDRVPQRIVSVKGMENKIPALTEFISKNIEASGQPRGKPFKAIIYCNSTADVALTTAALKGLRTSEVDSGAIETSREHPWGRIRILEIHARLTQQSRTRTAETFKNCISGILLSSDVTARGMDFPNVTHVIQMSTPPNREQYIHRIGRTARAGKDGEAVIFLARSEERDCREKLRDLNLEYDNSLQTAKVNMAEAGQIPVEAGRILSMVQRSMEGISDLVKSTSFRSLIGALKGSIPSRQLIPMLNDLAVYGWGMPSPPPTDRGLAQKLGIANVPGLVIGSSPLSSSSSSPSSLGSRMSSQRRHDRDAGSGYSRRGFGDQQDRSRFSRSDRSDADRPRFGHKTFDDRRSDMIRGEGSRRDYDEDPRRDFHGSRHRRDDDGFGRADRGFNQGRKVEDRNFEHFNDRRSSSGRSRFAN